MVQCSTFTKCHSLKSTNGDVLDMFVLSCKMINDIRSCLSIEKGKQLSIRLCHSEQLVAAWLSALEYGSVCNELSFCG